MNDPSPLEAIFFAALEKGSPPERAAYLDEACAGEADLRRRVEKMLAAQAQAGSFLEQPAHSPVVTVEEQPVSEGPGTVIGPYKLLEQIGEGGFGVVFLAEQTQPVRRKVALKVLKPGMDTRQVVARFEAERQALALMDHPCIAQVHDGGKTSDGRPYFVMELVKGIPITDYCDQCSLTTRERLDLFLSVCQAVQHAHQKGVIHRDIKPSNVLVAIQDGRPMVKVIDFGVAKAINQRLSEHTLQTGFHQMIGTPLYMSPEQAEMSPLDVDTRADIYSLGVLLYELLTGTTPFEKERLKEANYDELRRILREEEPPRPSARLSTLKDKLTIVAAQRRTEPRQLLRAVRGELDWIVMKCLEKDRNRRYETANGLARDIERSLQDEPVQACPPSVGYRLRKFVRRNKGAVLAASLVFLALVVGVIGTTWGLIRTEEQRAAAQAAANRADANADMAWDAADDTYTQVAEKWLAYQPHLEPVQLEFLLKARDFYVRYASANGTNPRVRHQIATAYLRVGAIQQKLGDREKALDAFQMSRQLQQELVEEFPDESVHRKNLAMSLNQMGVLYLSLQQLEKADEALQAACDQMRAVLRQEPNNVKDRVALIGYQSNLGVLLTSFGRLEQAEELFRKTISEATALTSEDLLYRHTLADLYGNLANVLDRCGRPQDAVTAYRECLALQEKLAAEFPRHWLYKFELAKTYENLAGHFSGAAPVEAEHLFDRAVTVLKKLTDDFPSVPEYHSDLARTYQNLAVLLEKTNRTQQAKDTYDQAIKIWEKLPGMSDDPDYRAHLAGCLNNLTPILRKLNQPVEAEKAASKALAIKSELVRQYPNNADYHSSLGTGLHAVADTLLARGDRRGAIERLEQAVEQQLAALEVAPKHPTYREHLRLHRLLLGNSYHGETLQLAAGGKREQAEEACNKAISVRQKLADDYPQEPDYLGDLAISFNNLGFMLCQRGQVREGLRFLEQAIATHQAALAIKDNHRLCRESICNAYVNLINARLRQGDHKAAAHAVPTLTRAMEDLSKFVPIDEINYVNAAGSLAQCVPLAEADVSLAEAERKELTEAYARRAIALVRKAVTKGFTNAGLLHKDPAFAPLRHREDFKRLVVELETKAAPPPNW
jgi:serine/threonine protein kinase/tetratricopeptide (TPR) repeat protein